jgi:hypothetical protein
MFARSNVPSSFRYLAIITAVFQGISLAQAPNPVSSPLSLQNLNALPRPAVPTDSLDPVTGGAQQPQTSEARLAAMTLLTKARQMSSVMSTPYDLKTTFVTSGGLPSDGSWTLEDIAPGKGVYRWSAQGPNYAAVNLYNTTTQGMLYSNQPGGVLPLRLVQVREAIFFNIPQLGPQAPLRTAVGYVNGAEQRCVLIGSGMPGQAVRDTRGWGDTEYCVDAATGLLTTYSPVPGLYVHYNYANAIKFHDKTVAGSFTISEAGRVVIDAKTESVSDPGDPKSALFDPAGMIAIGVGRVMTPAFNLRTMAPPDPKIFRSAPANLAVQVVVLHGSLSPDGHLGETELLASSDPSFNQKALDQANQFSKTMSSVARGQPGTTQQSHEMIFTFEFVTSQ